MATTEAKEMMLRFHSSKVDKVIVIDDGKKTLVASYVGGQRHELIWDDKKALQVKLFSLGFLPVE